MSVPLWPSELPQHVLVDGFALAARDGRLRVKTDAGPGKLRLATAAAVMPVQAEAFLVADQAARWQRWHDDELGGGVRVFWMRDLVYDGLVLADEDGVPLAGEDGVLLTHTAWWLVQLGERTQLVARPGLKFHLQLDLEVLP